MAKALAAVRTLALARPVETDRELLARYTAAGDEEAFAALVRRHGKTVLSACRQVLSDPADVDDAFQATFLVLLKKAKAVDAATPLGGWLYAVAHRVAVRCRADARRRRAREATAAARRRATTSLPDLTWREAAAVLHDELNALPDRYRLPLLLCVVRGLTRDEAAEQLGTTVGAVRGHLQRGRTLLARRLNKRGVALSAGLLAALVGGSRAAGGPPAELIDLTLRAAGGGAEAAVAALARGAVPMTVASKQLVLSTALFAGLVATSLALGGRPPAADDPPAMKAEAKAKTTDKPAEKPTFVAGTVTGPDGKPVAGAAVRVAYSTRDMVRVADERLAEVVAATSGPDGTFRGDLPKGADYFFVTATKAGLGVGWAEAAYPATTPANPHDLALRLTRDEPVRGKVIDTEGKPVAGLEVAAVDVIEPKDGNMDKLLAASADGGFGRVGQWEKSLHPPAGMGRTTTAADGTFELTRLGADRVVRVSVSGKNTARMSGFVISRAGVDVGPLNRKPAGVMKTTNDHPVFYPPAATFVAGPGYAIEGTVTAKATGKPVPGCTIQVNTGFWDNITTTTDAAGKYRLAGLSKGGSRWVHVHAPQAAEVFGTWADVKDPDGFATVKQDFALVPGAVFAGRVIDKETKQPVAASFQIIPTGDNEYAKRPEYETATRDMTWKGGGADGKFRIVTIPGPSKLNINVVPTVTRDGRRLNPYRTGQKMTIDLKPEGNAEFTVEVERGKTANVSVVGEDGRPVAGLTTTGQTLTDQGFATFPDTHRPPAGESRLTVHGLGGGEKRRLVVIQPEKKLGGTVTVGPDVNETLTLRGVQPVSGRFVDADGKPRAGLTVTIEYNDAAELFRDPGPFVLTAKTDADGKFVIPDVVPGLMFRLGIAKGDTSYRGVPRIGVKWVTAGKPLDLGTRTLEIAE